MAWVEQHRAWIGFLSGDFEAAHEKLQHSAATLEELGDRNGVGWVLGLLAYVEFFLCHFDTAEELATQVAVEAEERGDTWAAAMMQTLQANLRLWQGHLEDAAALAELARKRFRKLEDRYGLSQAMAPLLRAQTALGRTAAALRTEEELFAMSEVAPVGPNPLLAIAGAAMHRGDGALAAAHATHAIAEMRAAGQRGVGAADPAVHGAGPVRSPRRGRRRAGVVARSGVGPPVRPRRRLTRCGLEHDADRALAHADDVFADEGASSYLDQVMAHVGAAAALARIGDVDARAAARRGRRRAGAGGRRRRGHRAHHPRLAAAHR